MQIISQNLDEFDQQAENSLRRLNELWQHSTVLPTLQKQSLTEALEEHYLTLQELQVASEELRQQNEELAATRQVVEAERQRYQELFEFAPDGYLVTDPNAVILEANQAAANLLNCSQKNLVGKPLIVFMPAESRRNFHTKLNQLQSAKEVQEWEIQIQPRQNASFPAAFRVAVVQSDGQVVGLRWLLRDITEHKQYEAALESAWNNLEKQVKERTAELLKSNEQLKQEIAERQRAEADLQQLAAQAQVEEQRKLNRLKDDFLSTVSHELRTPLTNMKMAIQVLALSLNRNQPLFSEIAKPAAEQNRIARYFQILHNECEQESSLISDLLDLQRLYAGVQPLLLTSMQMQDWLPQIVKPFEERCQLRKQHLRIDISPEVPSFICDSASLKRLLSEFLDNACKYTPSGEQIVVTAQAQSGMMQLSVSNSGVEIPASELPLIFDKFYRVPNNDPWKQGGTGLGLALVQQMVAHLGGTLHVESLAGQTRFTLELPLKNVEI